MYLAPWSIAGSPGECPTPQSRETGPAKAVADSRRYAPCALALCEWGGRPSHRPEASDRRAESCGHGARGSGRTTGRDGVAQWHIDSPRGCVSTTVWRGNASKRGPRMSKGNCNAKAASALVRGDSCTGSCRSANVEGSWYANTARTKPSQPRRAISQRVRGARTLRAASQKGHFPWPDGWPERTLWESQ